LVDIILKKKRNQSLTEEEIRFVVDGFTRGSIPDYQVSALLMAICFNGLDQKETASLTSAMIDSGERIDLSSVPGVKVDKHSTGGVGDKTTLVLGPLVAAAGLPVAKMSGRGLGHTGGTLDKLESIPGFQVDISPEDFVRQVGKTGLAVCAQSQKLVPADKKLYALRDVTGTVENLSLIASSVMSKKLASGADAIVIDIKVGDGAFVKTVSEAEELASMMISTAQEMGKKLVAVITNMDQPLGMSVGNLLEVQEAIETLKGKGPDDLKEVCLILGSHMLVLGNRFDSLEPAKSHLQTLLENGKAFEKFCEFVESQGGDVEFVQSANFPESKVILSYHAKEEGYLMDINALEIGNASMFLGAGRQTKESTIDHLAGLVLLKKQGDFVRKGETLAMLHTENAGFIEKAKTSLDKAFQYSSEKPVHQPLILKTVL